MENKTAQQWNQEGVDLHNKGDYSAAIQCFENASRLDSGNSTYKNNRTNSLRKLAQAWNQRGIDLSEQGNYEDAIECYEKALKLDGWNVTYKCNKVNSLRKSGRLKEARHYYDSSVSASLPGIFSGTLPKKTRAYSKFVSGLVWYDMGNYRKAIADFNYALETDSKDASVWDKKGQALAKLGRYKEALKCFEEAIAISPSLTVAYQHRDEVKRTLEAIDLQKRGGELHRKGQYKEAIECYDKALAITPEKDSLWVDKGAALTWLEKRSEAISCYDRALEINARNDAALRQKGTQLRVLGKYDEAVTCLNQALNINSKSQAAWDDLGGILSYLGRNEKAIECFDKALKINKKRVSAWNNKGSILKKMGKNREALQCFSKALKIDPSNVQAKNSREAIENLFSDEKDARLEIEKARKIVDAARKKGLDDESILEHIEEARASLESGDYINAKLAAQRAQEQYQLVVKDTENNQKQYRQLSDNLNTITDSMSKHELEAFQNEIEEIRSSLTSPSSGFMSIIKRGKAEVPELAKLKEIEENLSLLESDLQVYRENEEKTNKKLSELTDKVKAWKKEGYRIVELERDIAGYERH